MVVVDEPKGVREEDSFDVEAVAEWLRGHAPADELESIGGSPSVRQFAGGASNLTYLLSYGDRELILRRPPAGTKAASAHDMRREYRIQESLRPAYPYVPKMVALCTDESVMGSDFYVMERIKGTILRGRIPSSTGLDESSTRQLCLSAIERLVQLHQADPAQVGLADIGKGDGYVRRQVEGWSERYKAAHTWNVPSFARVMTWLSERQPQDVGSTIVHNDYRFDNLVLSPEDPTRIVGVLDWEMATVGDPLMDLGSALAYWVQADDDRLMRALRRQPTDAPGMLTRSEVVERYCERTGREVDDWLFYEVFGLFRLATIVQQIYKRYHLRETRNRAFRHFWLGVRYLDRRCLGLIRHEGR